MNANTPTVDLKKHANADFSSFGVVFGLLEKIRTYLEQYALDEAFTLISNGIRIPFENIGAHCLEVEFDGIHYKTTIHKDWEVLTSKPIVVDGRKRGALSLYCVVSAGDVSEIQALVALFLENVAFVIAKHYETLDLKQQFSCVFQTHEAILVTDAVANIEQINDAFTEITGYETLQAVGKNPRFLRSGEHNQTFYETLWYDLINSGKWSGEIWNRKRDGSLFLCWQTITAVKDALGKTSHYVSVFMDITQRKRDQEWIVQQADYDPLTNLPNRRFFRSQLDGFLEQARNLRRFGAIMFIDVDHFKSVNELMGHHIGDQVLKVIGQRLVNCLGSENVIARMGGDEFVVLMINTGQHRFEAENNCQSIAEKIIRAFQESFVIESESFSLGCSIGVTLAPNGSATAHELIVQADTAMCHAKSLGRDNYCLYSPDIRRATDERMKLVHRLKNALDRDKITLYYQPQFDDQHRIIGAEALMRWIEDDKPVLSPPEIVKLAEHANITSMLGDWVVKHACMQLREWQEQEIPDSFEKLAVNISPRQFISKKFADNTLEIIRSCNIRPDQIMLEVTEDALIEDIDGVVATMVRLRGEGVRFALDDFGTGFSPLYYLSRLPLSTLKIDQSFVRNLDNIRNTGIVSSIIALGHKLGFDLIAEGVETKEQLAKLRSFGCRRFQGYLFSKAINSQDFMRLMKSHASQISHKQK